MECQSMATCREVLEKCLKVKSNFLNSAHDNCYCTNCYEGEEYYSRGKPLKRYVMPLGWCGFGILIDPRFDKEDIEQIFATYHVAYHGTTLHVVNQIIRTGFALPGDQFICTNIEVRPGHIPNKNEIYTSPSPNYSSFGDVYAVTFSYQGMKFKTMLQVRQHPTSYEVQGETVGGRCKNEKYISDKEIEWKTRKRDSIIPYRILIKLVDIKRNGFGIYQAADGSRYEGNWVNGKKHGKGTFISSDGVKRTGQWVDDMMDGEILVSNPSGEERKGEWKAGKLVKWLSYILPNGEKYTGDFLMDKRHGHGEYIYINGGKYIGFWANDKREGKGTYTSDDGSKYKGNFHEDKQHGKGELIYANGEIYNGNWVNNQRDGEGIYTNVNGIKYKGRWTKDKMMDGQGVKSYPNGDKYEGQFMNGKRHGYGIY